MKLDIFMSFICNLLYIDETIYAILCIPQNTLPMPVHNLRMWSSQVELAKKLLLGVLAKQNFILFISRK